MKRAPRSRQRHDLYAKYHDYDSEISDLLGECGLETAIASIRPGISAAEVDQSCREALARKGLQQFFRHRAAYGIGIGFPPNWSEGHIYSIRPDEPLILQPNMTFHVIPTLFLDSFGMCFSESVRVTESGCETLTSFERRLFTAD